MYGWKESCVDQEERGNLSSNDSSKEQKADDERACVSVVGCDSTLAPGAEEVNCLNHSFCRVFLPTSCRESPSRFKPLSHSRSDGERTECFPSLCCLKQGSLSERDFCCSQRWMTQKERQTRLRECVCIGKEIASEQRETRWRREATHCESRDDVWRARCREA